MAKDTTNRTKVTVLQHQVSYKLGIWHILSMRGMKPIRLLIISNTQGIETSKAIASAHRVITILFLPDFVIQAGMFHSLPDDRCTV